MDSLSPFSVYILKLAKILTFSTYFIARVKILDWEHLLFPLSIEIIPALVWIVHSLHHFPSMMSADGVRGY